MPLLVGHVEYDGTYCKARLRNHWKQGILFDVSIQSFELVFKVPYSTWGSFGFGIVRKSVPKAGLQIRRAFEDSWVQILYEL